jgi:hypothetical protein
LDSFDVTLGECHIGAFLHVVPSLPVWRVESLSTYQHEPSDWEVELEQQEFDGSAKRERPQFNGSSWTNLCVRIIPAESSIYTTSGVYQTPQVLRNINPV